MVHEMLMTNKQKQAIKQEVNTWFGVVLAHVTLYFLSSPDGSQSTPAKSLSLNLKQSYSSTLERHPTSTSVWPLQTSALSPAPVVCAESYLNLLNLENSTKPAALTDLDPFIRTNGTAEGKEISNGDIVQFSSRTSAGTDEK